MFNFRNTPTDNLLSISAPDLIKEPCAGENSHTKVFFLIKQTKLKYEWETFLAAIFLDLTKPKMDFQFNLKGTLGRSFLARWMLLVTPEVSEGLRGLRAIT